MTPAMQGRGYAAEAAAACMDDAVDRLGWDDVIHCIDRDNAASVRLAERLGSAWRKEIVPPKPYDGFKWQVYGQTAGDWRTRRGGR